MNGLASYRPSQGCPRRLIPLWAVGLLAGILGLAGCRPAAPEAAEKPAAVVVKAPLPEPVGPAERGEMAESVVPAKTQAEKLNAGDAVEPIEAPVEPVLPEVAEVTEEPDPELVAPVPLPAPEGATRLSPTEEVWINADEKKVYVGGQVSLRRGMLEMFACPKGTKEHESIVSVNSLAATVHAALLAVGAVPGTPVSYDPEYQPATGMEIDIVIEWKDPEGEWHTVNAREWVRNVRTGEELGVPWVFAGSGFYVDQETGKQHYLAESGDMICVSNFGTAMLDLPVESSQAESGLLFEAFTDRVPALGTPVRLVLEPKLEDQPPASGRKEP